MKLKNILVTTTSNPRYEGDIEAGGMFIEKLYFSLKDKYDIKILSPFTEGSYRVKVIDGILTFRYNFFPFNIGKLINKDGLPQTIKRNKLKLFIIPFILLFQLTNIISIKKKYSIDIIHANWIFPQGLVAAFYKRYFNNKIKLVVTAHGSDLNMNFGRIGNILTRFITNVADQIIVVSRDLQKIFDNINPNMKTNVIPMGIDTNCFKFRNENINSLRKELGIVDYMLLYVGIFTDLKGIDYIIRSLPEILNFKPSIKLVLVGDGTSRKRLEKLAVKLNVRKNIIFAGFVEQEFLPDYYSAADIVLMPSLSEGSPIVLPEALSCESIVITSDLPIFKQHIVDGSNGFIVPQNNSDAIHKKVRYILENYEQVKKIKKMNREYVIKYFDWNVISQKHDDIYKLLLKD